MLKIYNTIFGIQTLKKQCCYLMWTTERDASVGNTVSALCPFCSQTLESRKILPICGALCYCSPSVIYFSLHLSMTFSFPSFKHHLRYRLFIRPGPDQPVQSKPSPIHTPGTIPRHLFYLYCSCLL